MSTLLHTLVTSPDQVQDPAHGLPIGRPDTLTSQHIEVGIVLYAMLGEACAADYLARHDVASSVAQRVLSQPSRRRSSPGPAAALFAS
jgi:hypothetical protein